MVHVFRRLLPYLGGGLYLGRLESCRLHHMTPRRLVFHYSLVGTVVFLPYDVACFCSPAVVVTSAVLLLNSHAAAK